MRTKRLPYLEMGVSLGQLDPHALNIGDIVLTVDIGPRRQPLQESVLLIPFSCNDGQSVD
jgi:hypothetical protein